MSEYVIDTRRQPKSRNYASALTRSLFNRFAFEYDPKIEYFSHSKIIVGEMNEER